MSYTELSPLAIDIVSVQSQVVYGYVGNSVALPCLRAHGLQAVGVPTVLFSNTPHYPSIHGGAIATDWFQGYLQDLLERQALDHLRTVLVGYLGNPEQIQVLAQWLRQVQELRPELRIIIDPVIGDHDVGVYVAPGMLQAYREHLLPLAHGLIPNDFELTQLATMPIYTLDDAIQAARSLLKHQLEWIIATSAAPQSCPNDQLQLAVVTRHDAHIVRHPRIPSYPKGTGDMFGAELSAYLLAGHTLRQATELASAAVVKVIRRTHEAGSGEMLLGT